MKIKELKDLMMHFTESKYDDYDFVFWDYSRQKKMDGHFGSLSHPNKEIVIPIGVVGEDAWTLSVNDTEGLPKTIDSPFVKGAKADLVESEKDFSGIKYVSYMYRCRATDQMFRTKTSDTYSMYNYLSLEVERCRKFLRERDLLKEYWTSCQEESKD